MLGILVVISLFFRFIYVCSVFLIEIDELNEFNIIYRPRRFWKSIGLFTVLESKEEQEKEERKKKDEKKGHEGNSI